MKKIYTQKHIFKQQNKHGNTKKIIAVTYRLYMYAT